MDFGEIISAFNLLPLTIILIQPPLSRDVKFIPRTLPFEQPPQFWLLLGPQSPFSCVKGRNSSMILLAKSIAINSFGATLNHYAVSISLSSLRFD